jgi:hypothetical protein
MVTTHTRCVCEVEPSLEVYQQCVRACVCVWWGGVTRAGSCILQHGRPGRSIALQSSTGKSSQGGRCHRHTNTQIQMPPLSSHLCPALQATPHPCHSTSLLCCTPFHACCSLSAPSAAPSVPQGVPVVPQLCVGRPQLLLPRHSKGQAVHPGSRQYKQEGLPDCTGSCTAGRRYGWGYKCLV